MNLRVRLAEGVDGPIVLSAWCKTCRQQAMPMRNGTCGFCDTRIVSPEAAKAGAVEVRPYRVSDDDIVTELRAVAARLGRNPYSREWRGRISRSTIFRRFPTWAAALEAAGL